LARISEGESLTPTEFLALLAGISSGASIANPELVIRIARLILEQPDINFKMKRGTIKPVVQITALIDLEKLTSVKQL
jgi:hypothetical protein